MPRPTTRGLEYVFLDKNFFFDRKVKRLKRKCGDDAPYVYLALLCLIAPEGYYIKYDNDTVYDLADMTGFEEDKVAEILDTCGEVGLLDQEMMEEEHILTSHGIQKYYATTCAQLKRKNGVEEFSLLDEQTRVVSPEETHQNGQVQGVSSEETQFPPKNEEEIPTKGKERNIEDNKGVEGNREDSSCSSSSSPSPCVEVAPSEEEKQQEKFLSYMFFQNWAAPNKELERFIAFNNTENRCWAKMDKTQRESALILWKQKPEQPKRFGQSFLTLWGRIFDKMIEAGAPHEVLMHALSDNIAYKEPSTLQSEIHLPQDVRDFIEAHLDSHGFRQIFQKYLFAVRHTNKLMYYLCPP